MKFSEAVAYLEDNPQLFKISTPELADQGMWFFERHGVLGCWLSFMDGYQLTRLNFYIDDTMKPDWIMDYTNDKETR